jgi:hypothetical protein
MKDIKTTLLNILCFILIGTIAQCDCANKLHDIKRELSNIRYELNMLRYNHK